MEKSNLKGVNLKRLRPIYRVLKGLRSCNKAVIEVEKKKFFLFPNFFIQKVYFY